MYRIDRNRALVQTVDFFTPIVDEPFIYGQIAATNSLSDVYAMGGRPLTAMNILGVPTDVLPPQVINAILRGGATKAIEARCTLVGGHTIKNPEPIYGFSVTGIVSPRNILTNANARPGDLLILTKPLGTGIITTGIKRGLASKQLARAAINVMRALNTVGADLAEQRLIKAATDITGFGLLGHLASMCRASNVAAQIDPARLPVISPEVFQLIAQDCIPGGTKQNLEAANNFVDWQTGHETQQLLAADAQTSGGLLLCVPARNLPKVLRLLKHHKTPCATLIGKILKTSAPHILARPFTN